MDTITFTKLDRASASLSAAELAALAAGIRGGIVTARDAAYGEARKVWNATVDRKPAIIARCINSQDVRHAVNFARQHRMLVSLRGGGHNIAGSALADGGLVIDQSSQRAVRVDAERRTARVAPGALLGDVDRETQAYGLAVPLGVNSTTGIAGLTLGGGFGWLTRKHGMTVDNLISADIVTADGQPHTVSAESDPDLFWAIRGGGGNFGAVTSFEFGLHSVGPQVYAGLVVYPFDQARAVLQAWRELTREAPQELTVWTILRKAPPLPFLPASIHGKDVVVFALVYAGPAAAGEKAAAAVLDFGTPAGSALGAQPYAGFQAAFDPLLQPGARNYWKSNNFNRLDDGVLERALSAAAVSPGPECEVFIAHLGGAAAKIPAAATAYAGRDATYVMNIHGRWQAPADDQRVREWARRLHRECAPFSTGGGYANFFTEDEGERAAMAYGAHYPRLQAIKNRYDPDNLFRLNVNVAPAPAKRAA